MVNPDPELIGQARALLRGLRKASLGTLAERASELFPFVSLVEAAPAGQGEIILLLSDLSDHARHLNTRPKAALMIDATLGHDQPLAGPRLTILGQVRRSPDPAAERALYLERFPAAELYADFGDFHFYRLTIEEGYFVAGFGRIARLQAADLN